jgi:hypothetical protein
MPNSLSDPGATLQLYQGIFSWAAVFFAVSAGLAFVACLVFIARELLAAPARPPLSKGK